MMTPAVRNRPARASSLAKERSQAEATGHSINPPSAWSSIFGLHNYRLFGQIPSWIDPKKAPGFTPLTDIVSFTSFVSDIITGKYLFLSPNATWLSLSLAYYALHPYDSSPSTPHHWIASFTTRLAFNFTACFAYYSFFFVHLYMLQSSKRKFYPGSWPTRGNMAHNVWFWALGVVQWSFLEVLMEKLWKSEVVTVATFADLRRDPRLLALNVAVVLLVPIWRDFHFYSAHRFIHLRAIYKYVHSLHHRNTDPEPFSGMTMHPVEHLYYFSNVFIPSLYLNNLSPFVFSFCFFHLTMAPAAGHSGFEDHFG